MRGGQTLAATAGFGFPDESRKVMTQAGVTNPATIDVAGNKDVALDDGEDRDTGNNAGASGEFSGEC